MDMRVSGSGQIPPGEYEKVRISGSGKLHGLVRCESFHSSGSSSGEEIECKNELHVSGSSKFEKSIKAESISASGSLYCGGSITVEAELKCAGSVKCDGNIKCSALTVAGGLTVGGDVEAENVKVSGKLNCDGLLNAEEIEIKFSYGMSIGSIGGSKILIYRESGSKAVSRLPLFSSIVKNSKSHGVHVKNSIEGDNIALEGVTAERVSGRIVAIGEDCEIDLVQYSEDIEISPKAKVGKTEKI